MQSTKYTDNDTDTHIVFNQILEIVVKRYKKCIPAVIKHRKNVDKLVQPDTVIIACVLWGFMLGYKSHVPCGTNNFQAEPDTLAFVRI